MTLLLQIVVKAVGVDERGVSGARDVGVPSCAPNGGYMAASGELMRKTRVRARVMAV